MSAFRVIAWIDGDRLRTGIVPAERLAAAAPIPLADRAADAAVLTRVGGLALTELDRLGFAR